ncbi:unnamed protein product [Darwinula stevensoni]|uniref:YTH domain-containing protein n=1 Tax=Darwinula stevensoni TaxID=69355 RepID=A0A7R8X732_9CRUS|nr:unnamed protein product [Darwinula stevensoni]CAG0887497.1 unnamed protein product [Darwinula stevensoni]
MKGQSQQDSNGPRDGVNEHEDFDSWRGHHQGYTGAMSTSISDAGYIPNYYGTSAAFPYQTGFRVGDGPWSNGDPMTFLGGYGGQISHDSYNLDGMFGPSGFSGFGQPSFNYQFHGNGDYSAWGSNVLDRSKPHYGDYYRDMYGDDRSGLRGVEQGMQGLALGPADPSGVVGGARGYSKEGISGGSSGVKSSNDVGIGVQKKQLTWASIASQPAKLSGSGSKSNKGGVKGGLAGMVPTGLPGSIGTWDSSGKGGLVGKNIPGIMPPPPPAPRPAWGPSRGGRGATSASAPHVVGNMGPMRGGPPYGMPSPGAVVSSGGGQAPASGDVVVAGQAQAPAQSHPILDELRMRNEYNPKEYDLNPKGGRFFVIKSYSEDDIHRSIKYEIWCSTEHGNKRLDSAFREREEKGPIYLFYSVNGSGHFCGMAQMVSCVDYNSTSNVWAQDKWKGQFKVKWIYVKDVPNTQLRHIRLENNENKPVTNSRDTQEVPYEKGKQVLKIMHHYKHTTSIFDDFIHYEKRQEEEEQRRQSTQGSGNHPPGLPKEDGERGRGARKTGGSNRPRND